MEKAGYFLSSACVANLMSQLDSWEWDINQPYFEIAFPLCSFFGILTRLILVAMLTLGPCVLGL